MTTHEPLSIVLQFIETARVRSTAQNLLCATAYVLAKAGKHEEARNRAMEVEDQRLRTYLVATIIGSQVVQGELDEARRTLDVLRSFSYGSAPMGPVSLDGSQFLVAMEHIALVDATRWIAVALAEQQRFDEALGVVNALHSDRAKQEVLLAMTEIMARTGGLDAARGVADSFRVPAAREQANMTIAIELLKQDRIQESEETLRQIMPESFAWTQGFLKVAATFAQIGRTTEARNAFGTGLRRRFYYDETTFQIEKELALFGQREGEYYRLMSATIAAQTPGPPRSVAEITAELTRDNLLRASLEIDPLLNPATTLEKHGKQNGRLIMDLLLQRKRFMDAFTVATLCEPGKGSSSGFYPPVFEAMARNGMVREGYSLLQGLITTNRRCYEQSVPAFSSGLSGYLLDDLPAGITAEATPLREAVEIALRLCDEVQEYQQRPTDPFFWLQFLPALPAMMARSGDVVSAEELMQGAEDYVQHRGNPDGLFWHLERVMNLSWQSVIDDSLPLIAARFCDADRDEQGVGCCC